MRERISSTHSVMCSIVQPTQNKLYELTAQRYKIMEDNNFNIPLRSGETPKKSLGNFFNTVHLTGKDLKKGERKTQTQSTKILDFLRGRLNEKFTSSEIRKALIETGIMPESTQESTIRARLTGLYQGGFVEKLDELKDGFYGMPNHLWTVKRDIPQVIEVSNVNLQMDIF